MGAGIWQVDLVPQKRIRTLNPPRRIVAAIPDHGAIPSVSEGEIRNTVIQKRTEKHHVRHERDLVSDIRQRIVPKASPFLGVRNLGARRRVSIYDSAVPRQVYATRLLDGVSNATAQVAAPGCRFDTNRRCGAKLLSVRAGEKGIPRQQFESRRCLIESSGRAATS